MAGRFFALRSVAGFAPGFFDRTAVEGDCVQLSREGEQCSASGTYTSVPFRAEPFFSLLPSWNADTPQGTRVEAFVRVAAGGRWSRWFGFGEWSPFISRASRPPEADEIARVEGGVLSLPYGRAAAESLQLRIQLFSDGEQRKTPRVCLLAASTNAARQLEGEEREVTRVQELPAYSCLNRDPAIAGRIAGVTSLTMLMNRWGRDLLPEEVARACYDAAAGGYDNLSFMCAVAGMCGFVCHAAYAGVAALRDEIWRGRCAAALVHYRAPSLAGQAAGEERRLPPLLDGAAADSAGHLVAVRGFARRGGGELVVIHDPLALTNGEVLREVPLAEFTAMYMGIAVFMDKGAHQAGGTRPHRRLAQLSVEGGALRMLLDGEELAPARLSGTDLGPATLCYTLSDSVAYASCAQKNFFYPVQNERGVIPFDPAGAPGRKLTCYLVASCGRTYVAERILPEPDEELEI